jgi:hypothetical protein
MALFTDEGIFSAEDLRRYESSILDMASTEGIELDAKLELARCEIGVKITEFLLEHEAGVRYARDLSHLVVTEPLAQWHAMQTLALIYRDAFNIQNNDRYLGKSQEYERLAKDAGARCFEVGVGITTDPIAKAALPDCGSFGGGTLPLSSYYVQAAWQSSTGHIGAASDLLPVTTSPGTLLTVRAQRPPANAIGWLVYVGQSQDEMRQQNPTPIAIGGTWMLPATGLQPGFDGRAGQRPDFYVTRRNEWRRG